MARLDATTNKQGALKFMGRLFEDLASATSGGGNDETILDDSLLITTPTHTHPHTTYHHHTTTTFPTHYTSALHDKNSDLLYTPQQRRLLDISLLQWIDSKGVLKRLGYSGTSTSGGSSGGGGNTTLPPTILVLEKNISDGTLLCMLSESILNLAVPMIVDPKTYKQCLDNIHRCTWSLKNIATMGGCTVV